MIALEATKSLILYNKAAVFQKKMTIKSEKFLKKTSDYHSARQAKLNKGLVCYPRPFEDQNTDGLADLKAS